MIGVNANPRAPRPLTSVTVRGKEFVKEISSSILTSSQINPLNSLLFPALSQTAAAYDRYKFNSLSITVASGTPTTQAGRYVIAWDADSEDAVAGVEQLYNMPCNVASSVWATSTLDLPKQSEPKFCGHFVDKVQDHGRVFVYPTTSMQAGMYVEYNVTLMDLSNVGSSVLLKGTLDRLLSPSATLGPYHGPQFIKNHPVVKQFELAPGYYKLECRIAAQTANYNDWNVTSQAGGSTTVRLKHYRTDAENFDLVFTDMAIYSSNGTVVTIGTTYSGYFNDRSYLFVARLTKGQYEEFADSINDP
jgi:hypothetical protein